MLVQPSRYNAALHRPTAIAMSLLETEGETARLNMVEHQLRPNKVTDRRVLSAFGRIRRELFVPEPLRGIAYIDEDLPLGGGRFLMEPMVAARLLQAATGGRAESALVIGAGGGYEVAVLSLLVRHVVALEADPQMARQVREALVEHGIAGVGLVEGPLDEGWRERAPYDVILFTGAVGAVPADVADQLADEGRLAAVVNPGGGVGQATLVTRTGGALGRRVLFDAATPFLPGFAPRPAFVF